MKEATVDDEVISHPENQCFTAGINLPKWGHKIEVHSSSREGAIAERDQILSLLQQEQTVRDEAFNRGYAACKNAIMELLNEA